MPGKLTRAGRDRILERGIKIAEANLPSWLTELALSTAYAAKSVETSKSDVGHRHDNATGVADGFMAAADKAKLDAATDQAVGGTVVARNGAGDIDVRNVFATVAPTLTGHLTRKDYVDNKVAAVTYSTLGVIPNASLPERLGRYGSTLPGDNWNNARENGVFMSSAGANSPQAGAWFIGEVIAHNDVYVTQTVFNFTNDGSGNTQTWRRGLENGTWGGWYRLQISQDEQDARYQALIAAGTTAQYYRGDKTWQTLNKAAVGLGNVDNTSDANKPVSTAQAAAFVPKWKTGTAYAIGDQVVTPWNMVMSALSAHTSSAAFATDVSKWAGESTTPFGHMGRTQGFQSFSGTVATVIMAAAQELRGGFTFDDANEALIVPVTGRYRVHLKGFFSGGSSAVNQTGITVNGVAASAGIMQGLTSSSNKDTSGADIMVHSMGVVPLNVNDKVAMWHNTAASCWGTNGYDGSFIELEYVGGL